jgi:hypothetical protein
MRPLPPAGKWQEPAGRLPSVMDRSVKTRPAPGRGGGGYPPALKACVTPPYPPPLPVMRMAADPPVHRLETGCCGAGNRPNGMQGVAGVVGVTPLPPLSGSGQKAIRSWKNACYFLSAAFSSADRFMKNPGLSVWNYGMVCSGIFGKKS